MVDDFSSSAGGRYFKLSRKRRNWAILPLASEPVGPLQGVSPPAEGGEALPTPTVNLPSPCSGSWSQEEPGRLEARADQQTLSAKPPRMKALATALPTALLTALLTTLLCAAQGAVSNEVGPDRPEPEDLEEEENYDDDYLEYEAPVEGNRGSNLRCYTCESQLSKEFCLNDTPCPPSSNYCKTLVSSGLTDSGHLTTYSMWCADACEPLTKTVHGTLVMVSCCSSSLCGVEGLDKEERDGAAAMLGGSLAALGASVLLSLLGAGL
ncbi:glycosylphosphatidylinositol-anchored high density lipoprotein-binding protein 1 isoform X2 [Tachyglossus aculeatus]|uniref:glycosylphosphatidylinositol-anchored high density lipoprotein-binding protein 1 isoform X2 n=1 Tax=Tachyglossus aculeatus TaxID=9261 RepID=UPI0018F4DC9B|nr:glycosylphosphatidylinositol-anchored high density lipoprotein-binding protein 1 isoform X2 [Tachyglossus aculeatus]